MNKYSFVLPAYKAHFFKEAIDSILAQTYTDFELIIVNDASPEDLDSIVKSYDDPRIRYYVNEQNIGGKDLVAQWNHCLEYATGEYIILASDDDVYFPQYLEKMDALVRKYPNVNVFRPRVQRIDADGNIVHIEGFIPEYTSLLEFPYYRFCEYIQSGIPFYIIKKEILLANGGFVSYPLAWYADDAIVAIMAQNGMVSSSEILFSFRVSGESISTKENDASTLKKKIEATNQYYDWFTTFIEAKKTKDKYAVLYKKSVLEAIPGRRKGQYDWDLRHSSFSAIWNNKWTILKDKLVSFRYLVLLLYKKL